MAKPVTPERRVYGRRLGRPLSPSRSDALDAVLPSLSIPPNRLDEGEALHPDTLFSTPCAQYWLEIGFGNGEHLLALIQRHPDIGFMGAEPYINGMSAFLKSLPHPAPENVRVLMDDAMKLVNSLQDQTLERIYILNPDPWPKKRHHKRRIVNSENLDAFARVLKPDGQLIMATDVDDLAGWMVTHATNHPVFTWTAECAADWQNPPADWALITRYAAKGEQAGRRQSYLVFKRT
ncbi:MAG: tRNA (guanosine(46)-N7)-methyltransferase TrmB [Alphaproteobacteria bacterium]|nr:tRNA (guanosine(46)-N7)-methyltransferase TrmB [Alphaproteobacteria bacterium]